MRLAVLSVALVMALASVYGADDWPSLKEGLWSIHRETTDQPGSKKIISDESLCRTHAYDDKARARSEAMLKNCKSNVEHHVGLRYETERDCTFAGTTLHATSTITVTGDTEFHSEETTTYTPAFTGTTETKLITEQKYVGACPAGMEPGDIKSADGKIRHTGRQ